MTTGWQQHISRWENCSLCELHLQRTQVVLGRGELPASILFLAEAPGISEDATGEPLVGPAGQVLDRMIRAALQHMGWAGPPPTMAFTNVVACFPREAKKTSDHRPPQSAIKACSPRLREFVDICEPRVVVLVGDTAEKWAGLSVDMASEAISVAHVMHPSAVGKMDLSQQGLAFKRCVLRLAKALEVLR